MLDTRDRQDTPFIAQQALHQVCGGQPDRVVGGAFALDDLVGGPAHLVGQCRLSLRSPPGPAPQWQAADHRRGPEHDLGVAVFAHDVRVHRMRIDVQFARQHLPQSRGVEHRPCAQHAGGRELRRLGHHLRQDVDGIGDHHELCLGSPAAAGRGRVPRRRCRAAGRAATRRARRRVPRRSRRHPRPPCPRPPPSGPSPADKTSRRGPGPCASPSATSPRASQSSNSSTTPACSVEIATLAPTHPVPIIATCRFIRASVTNLRRYPPRVSARVPHAASLVGVAGFLLRRLHRHTAGIERPPVRLVHIVDIHVQEGRDGRPLRTRRRRPSPPSRRCGTPRASPCRRACRIGAARSPRTS